MMRSYSAAVILALQQGKQVLAQEHDDMDGKAPEMPDINMEDLMGDEGLMNMLSGLFEKMGEGEDGNPIPVKETCPEAGKDHAVPKMDEMGPFKVNGCGPDFMPMKESFGLHKCCNVHDVCYAACGSIHKECEGHFKTCTDHICGEQSEDKQEDCKKQAKTFAGMSKGLGRSSHEAAQQKACDCVSEDDFKPQLRKYLEAVGEKYELDQAIMDLAWEEMPDVTKENVGEFLSNFIVEHGISHGLVEFDGIPNELHDYKDEQGFKDLVAEAIEADKQQAKRDEEL